MSTPPTVPFSGNAGEFRLLSLLGIEPRACKFARFGQLLRLECHIAAHSNRNGNRARLPDKHGSTPLHIAALNGQAGAIQLLLRHSVDINARNSSGFTPLHLAAYAGSIECLQVIMSCKDIDVFATDNQGNNALHWAAYAGTAAAVKFLLQRKLSCESKNRALQTPLMRAAENGRPDCVESLLTCGAIGCSDVGSSSSSSMSIDAQDSRGCTALAYAAFYSHRELPKGGFQAIITQQAVNYFFSSSQKRYFKCMVLLVSYGANVSCFQNASKLDTASSCRRGLDKMYFERACYHGSQLRQQRVDLDRSYLMTDKERFRYTDDFNKADVDKLGFIGKGEALELIFSYLKSANACDSPALLHDMSKEIFALADVDGDSCLSKSETCVALHLTTCVTVKALPMPTHLPSPMASFLLSIPGLASRNQKASDHMDDGNGKITRQDSPTGDIICEVCGESSPWLQIQSCAHPVCATCVCKDIKSQLENRQSPMCPFRCCHIDQLTLISLRNLHLLSTNSWNIAQQLFLETATPTLLSSSSSSSSPFSSSSSSSSSSSFSSAPVSSSQVFLSCGECKAAIVVSSPSTKTVQCSSAHCRGFTHLCVTHNMVMTQSKTSSHKSVGISGKDIESARFCLMCRNEEHQNDMEKLSKKEILRTTHPCPRCKTRTQKNGACMHMTCQVCKHEYFWCCSRSYRVPEEMTLHNRDETCKLRYPRQCPRCAQMVDWESDILAVCRGVDLSKSARVIAASQGRLASLQGEASGQAGPASVSSAIGLQPDPRRHILGGQGPLRGSVLGGPPLGGSGSNSSGDDANGTGRKSNNGGGHGGECGYEFFFCCGRSRNSPNDVGAHDGDPECKRKAPYLTLSH